MAKIVRYNGNLVPFASSALGTERTIFGEVTQADDITSQFTPDFLRGWGIVGPSDQPTLQDFNAVSYTHGQILAYLHQAGVAEYNAAQEYHIGSLCNVAGEIYSSIVNTNVGNTPSSSPSSWASISSGRRINVQKFDTAGAFVYAPTPGTKRVRVRLVGGGGAGGGAAASAGGSVSIGSGGGAGGYSEGLFDVATITGLTVTVGTGGAGALAAAGSNGSTTSIGSLITASGGGGGITVAPTSTFPFQVNGAASGVGTLGSIVNARGGSGLAGTVTAAGNAISGLGGQSVICGGSSVRTTTGTGNAGVFGSGGSGALVLGVTGTNYAGGAGGSGFVEIEELS